MREQEFTLLHRGQGETAEMEGKGGGADEIEAISSNIAKHELICRQRFLQLL